MAVYCCCSKLFGKKIFSGFLVLYGDLLGDMRFCSESSHMLLQNAYVPLCINGAFTDVKVTNAVATNTPHTMVDDGF